MTPLETKVEILKAIMQQPPTIPNWIAEKVVENRKLNITNIDDAVQVQPIILVKMVNAFYKELNK
jgi:hypothetical protein